VAVKAAIARMLQMGSRYHVTLACGHSCDVSKAELDRSQWFIGRRIQCRKCKETK